MSTNKTNQSAIGLIQKAIKEVEGVFAPSTFFQLDELSSSVLASNNIICYGVGREGLIMKSLTMRLMHLGLNAFFVGDMNVPPLVKGDLLLVSQGPGYFSTVDSLVAIANDVNGKVISFTARPDLLRVRNYQQVVKIEAQTMADDQSNSKAVLPMGSLYEISLFLFFEIVILSLREKLGESSESMRSRHTNLE